MAEALSLFSQVSFPASRRRIAAYDASKGLFHMANLVPAMYHRDIKPLNIVLDKPHPQNPVQETTGFCLVSCLVKNPRTLTVFVKKSQEGKRQNGRFWSPGSHFIHLTHGFATHLPQLCHSCHSCSIAVAFAG